MTPIMLIFLGIAVGIGAAFTGLGGGFLMVPLLLLMGLSPGKAVGTSFLAILLISISAIVAHNRLAHVDYRLGLYLAFGGLIGAQIGARLVDMVPETIFKRIFAGILFLLAIYLIK
jgi:hypothetical protein